MNFQPTGGRLDGNRSPVPFSLVLLNLPASLLPAILLIFYQARDTKHRRVEETTHRPTNCNTLLLGQRKEKNTPKDPHLGFSFDGKVILLLVLIHYINTTSDCNYHFLGRSVFSCEIYYSSVLFSSNSGLITDIRGQCNDALIGCRMLLNGTTLFFLYQ